MHLAFLLRGHKDWADRFINELSTRYLPFRRYDHKAKKMSNGLIQMRVCPIQLYDVCFPQEHYDAVANTLFRGDLGGKGLPMNSKHQKLIWALRQAMGFKKLPEFKINQKLPMQPPDNLEIIGIGVKPDKWITEKGDFVNEKDKTDLSYEGI